MTPRLPAIPEVEAKAFAVAKQWFAYWRAYRDAGDPLMDAPLTAACGAAWWPHLLRLKSMGPVDHRLWLVAQARNGDTDAHDIVMECIRELRSYREPVPIEYDVYDMDFGAGLLHAKHKPGPKKKARLTRDWFIALAVALLMDRFGPEGLKETRRAVPSERPRQSPPRRSASIIVAEAYVAEVQGLMDFKRVEQICLRCRGGMPTIPGWSAMVLDSSDNLTFFRREIY